MDSTFSEQSSDIELTQNDSIIFSASGEVHTSKKTFNGSWYIKDRNILILDVDWGQKTNEIKLGSGTWMLFKIITLDKEAMILESENSKGISTHYFSRIVKY